MNAAEKVERFLKVALKYCGKEIAVPSDQFFCIDQVVDPDKVQEGFVPYRVQYGFPKTGAVRVDFYYSNQDDSILIDGVKVVVPPANVSHDMFTVYPHVEKDVFGVHVNVGLDTTNVEHSTLESIEQNPKAMQLLDAATADLYQAVVLGDCDLTAEEGSEVIPCCVCSPYPHEEK